MRMWSLGHELYAITKTHDPSIMFQGTKGDDESRDALDRFEPMFSKFNDVRSLVLHFLTSTPPPCWRPPKTVFSTNAVDSTEPYLRHDGVYDCNPAASKTFTLASDTRGGGNEYLGDAD